MGKARRALLRPGLLEAASVLPAAGPGAGCGGAGGRQPAARTLTGGVTPQWGSSGSGTTRMMLATERA
jgi:hypothetical protein